MLVIHQYCPLCDNFPRLRAEEMNSVCAELSLTLCSEKSAGYLSPALSTGTFKESIPIISL